MHSLVSHGVTLEPFFDGPTLVDAPIKSAGEYSVVKKRKRNDDITAKIRVCYMLSLEEVQLALVGTRAEIGFYDPGADAGHVDHRIPWLWLWSPSGTKKVFAALNVDELHAFARTL